MPPAPGPSIFVSYSSLERAFTLKLAADLKNAGLNVWVDCLDGIVAGVEWDRALEQAINSCAAMIAVLSPDYVASTYCRNELSRAQSLKRPIFTVLLRPVPATDFPIHVQRQQHVDFTAWHDDAAYRARLEELQRQLIATVNGKVPVPLDAEASYLNRLNASLEAKRGVTQYIELGAEAQGAAENRPPPPSEDEWGYVWLVRQSNAAPAGDTPPPSRQRLTGVAEALDAFPRFLLLGKPGAGKSTALRRLVRDDARKRLDNPSAVPLPLLLELGAWRSEPTPQDFVRAHWPFAADPVDACRGGDVRLYLDGFNEMGARTVERATQIRQWLASSDGPSRAIVASRDSALDLLRDFHLATVKIEDLEESQIRRFAVNYLQDRAADFLDRVLPVAEAPGQPRSLLPLVRNPYLLSCLIVLFENDPSGGLPTNTGALFRRVARALWEREGKRGTPGWIPFEQAEPAFARLAFAMIDEGLGTAVPEEYAVGKVAAPGLLAAGESASYLTRDGGMVRFYHQLLQEYFAAVGLGKTGVKSRLEAASYSSLPGGVRMDPLLWPSRGATKWDEAIVALCGIVDDPSELVSEVLKRDPSLAGRCVETGILLDPGTRSKTIQRLVAMLRESDFPVSNGLMEALRRLGDSEAAPGLVEILRSGRPQGYHTADPRQFAAMALGGIGGSIAVAGLAEALGSESPSLRIRAADSLAELGDPTAAPGMVAALWDDSDTPMYFSTLRCLAKIAKGALVSMGDRAPERVIPALLEGLKNIEPRIRLRSAEILGQLGDLSTCPALTAAATYDVDARVRAAAANAVCLIGKSQDFAELVAAMGSSDGMVTMKADYELRQVTGGAAVSRLVRAMANQSDPDTMRRVRESLRMAAERVTLPLIDCLDSDTERERAVALDLLANVGDLRAVPALERKLQDATWDPRAIDDAIRRIRPRHTLWRG